MLSLSSAVVRAKGVASGVRLLLRVASTQSGANVFNMSASGNTGDSSHQETRNPKEIVTKKIEVDGIKLSYDITGSGRHLLFLLPGALGSVKTDFKYQMENFNKDLFTLIGWDPPGYGYSIPPNRDWPQHFLGRDADMALKMLQALGIENCSLLGWSDGGITALMVAARSPGKIRKMVVWGAAAFVTEGELPVYEKIRNIDSWNAEFRNSLLTVYKEDYLRKEFCNWVDAYSRYVTDNNGDICQSELDKIKCPTLILHGERDPLVPKIHPDFLAKKILNSKLHNFAEGRHNIHQRYYKEFNSIVEGFLIEP